MRQLIRKRHVKSSQLRLIRIATKRKRSASMSTTSSSAGSSHSGRMASILHAFHIGPNPAIIARMDALRAALATVKVDIDTRRFFIDLLFASGCHCAACSPLGKVCACGPACALLRFTPSSVLPGNAEGMTDK
jgi:hypothetical protein